MKKNYEQLRAQYPEYISLDQFYKICHIAKRSAQYLVQHGIVPAVDTGKRTWRYQIAIADVIAYLQQRDEQCSSMIPPGAASSRPSRSQNTPLSFSSLVKQGKETEVYRYFEQLYAKAVMC